ncbi:MAG: hypothetical protein QME77_02005 [bacterium]|nr:hypothetical protein [bacterium]
MKVQTASATITFARTLESESAEFYETLSQKHPEHKDVFLSFARENAKNVAQIERAYYGVITDAIEGCFAFNIETDEYAFDAGLAEDSGLSDALGRAVEIEGKILKFYSDAVEQSKPLMADVPRAFEAVAKRRRGRRPQLEHTSEASSRRESA